MRTMSSPALNFGTTTTTLLLDQLKDESNQQVWIGFDSRYRPIICGVARRLGLPPEDAADVAQETLSEFVRDYRRGRYERGKGRLRAWILGIARHRSFDLLRARSRERNNGVVHSDSEADLPSLEETAAAWQLEEERAIFQTARTEMLATTKADPATLRVFELVAVQGIPTDAAARECGISVEQARLAKHRLTKRLQEIVARLTQMYDADR